MSGRIPAPVRKALKKRAAEKYDGDVEMCEICDKQRGSNAHHRKNASQGGPNILSNLMWICGSGVTGCHGYVTSHPEAAVRAGWTIQGTVVEPWQVECRYRDGKAFLYDDGSVMPSDWEGELA